MKVTSRIDGSICGAILSCRPAARARCLQTAPSPQTLRGDSQVARISRPRQPISCSHTTLRWPAHCPHTSKWLISTFLRPQAQRQGLLSSPRSVTSHRHYSSSAAAIIASTEAASPPRTLNRDELLSLVDQQDAGSVDEHLDFVRDPYLRRYAQPDGPHLTISDKREDRLYPSHEEALRGDENIVELVSKLRVAVASRHRHRHRTSLESVYNIYMNLPEPRMLNLPAGVRQRFLRALGTPEKRDTDSMLRYFSAVADVKNAGLTLRRVEWNYALAFASRYVGTASGAEVESALRLWREMEREAGIRGNDVTFNILFDVASKSGNFTLAEMIYKEMEARGIPFNRYHHVSLIHFFGLKMDGNGVRAAYKEMVEAGEMIDTVVLNCVISGFLRSGEDAAAETVYDRMKAAYVAKEALPERDYVMNRVVTRVLMMFSKVGKEHPSLVPSFQEAIRIDPDLQTYRLLVNHFAVKIGDISKVARYLDEMRWFQVPLHGAIFLALFKGFYLHGGQSQTAEWNEQRLKGVFSALITALDDGVRGLYVDSWLVGYVLKAFMRCSSEEMVREAYDMLQSRWTLDAPAQQYAEDLLYRVLSKDPRAYKEGIRQLGSGMMPRRKH